MATVLEVSGPNIVDRLPPELIHVICEYLPTHDLSSFRLVSKNCAKIGERHIVQELHVMFNTKSFQNLLSISEHPTLSQHVVAVVYEVRFLQNLAYLYFEDNLADRRGAEDMSGLHDQEFKDVARAAWTAYKSMLDHQVYMRRRCYDHSVFTRAFARFPALKRIEMTAGFSEPSGAWKRAYKDTLALGGGMVNNWGVEDGDAIGIRGLGPLLLAVAANGNRIETLRASHLHWSFFDPAPMDLYAQAFTHLRDIDLVLLSDSPTHIQPKEIGRGRQVELGKALRAATKLERLRLSIDGERSAVSFPPYRRGKAPLVWEVITEAITWPNLGTLQISAAVTSETAILDFLERHKSSLTEIEWTRMWLTDVVTGWRGVFSEMRRHGNIRKAEFHGVWIEDDKGGTPALLDMNHEEAGFSKMVLGEGEEA